MNGSWYLEDADRLISEWVGLRLSHFRGIGNALEMFESWSDDDCSAESWRD